MKELICKFFSFNLYIILNAIFVIGRRFCYCSYCSVDEIELVFKDTVVESFGVDAQSSFCLNTWVKGSLQY